MNIHFLGTLIFRNDVFFYHDGIAYRLNYRVWKIREELLGKKSILTFHCLVGTGAGGIIWPPFWNGPGYAITVNADRYSYIITQISLSLFDDIGLEEIWFHQDGTTCHILPETFTDNIVDDLSKIAIISGSE